MQDTMVKLDAYKAANGHYPAALADLPGGAPQDAWGRSLVYKLPGLGADYDLMCLGADGAPGGEGLDADISSAAAASLVATWFDYTPTSALDIDMNTKPGELA
jgi:Type II secretion system (T2SS), protein G